MSVPADGSAAGQLRLMSAQQRAPQPPPQLTDAQPPGTSGVSPIYAQQQRRTLGNITNAASPGAQGSKSPARVSPGGQTALPVPAKPQFYTHNPNIRSRLSLSYGSAREIIPTQKFGIYTLCKLRKARVCITRHANP